MFVGLALEDLAVCCDNGVRRSRSTGTLRVGFEGDRGGLEVDEFGDGRLVGEIVCGYRVGVSSSRRKVLSSGGVVGGVVLKDFGAFELGRKSFRIALPNLERPPFRFFLGVSML